PGKGGTHVLLSMLRFRNTARRGLPWIGWAIPRLAERRFAAAVQIQPQVPDALRIATPVVGLGRTVTATESMRGLADGAERAVLLSTAGLLDYAGPVDQSIGCSFTVDAAQTSRRLWLFERRRPLRQISVPFALRVIPEEPNVEGRLVAGREPEY